MKYPGLAGVSQRPQHNQLWTGWTTEELKNAFHFASRAQDFAYADDLITVLDANCFHARELENMLDGASITRQLWQGWHYQDPRPNERRVFCRIIQELPA